MRLTFSFRLQHTSQEVAWRPEPPVRCRFDGPSAGRVKLGRRDPAIVSTEPKDEEGERSGVAVEGVVAVVF